MTGSAPRTGQHAQQHCQPLPLPHIHP
jgi:hypothetical protein